MHAHPDLDSKKQLAAYYTPKELSSILANYIIDSPGTTVLEPSFGGGGIITAALTRLTALGTPDAEKYVFGCDIDNHAFENLPIIIRRKLAMQTNRFVKQDFLTLSADYFSNIKFDCVIANPPYIGYGQMPEGQREIAKALQKEFNLKGSRASTWYFFLLKSLTYLKDDGKIAFVLPHAFLDSDYAKDLRDFIGNKFKTSAAYIFSKRIFAEQGTSERVLVLVAEGWNKHANYQHSLQAVHVESFDDFTSKIYSYRDNRNFGKKYLGSKVGRIKGKLNNLDTSFLNTYLEHPSVSLLSSHVKIRIGLVAGDAPFFTFNNQKIINKSLKEKFFSPLMRSLRSNLGVSFGKKDFRKSALSAESCYLLEYREDFLATSSYRKYLESYDLEIISNNKTFNKRDIWCQVNDGLIPDFFITYMCIHGPRIVINNHKANCLNNTHRGFVKYKFTAKKKKLLSLSMLTSFTRLVAEMESKLYGNATLKMEPTMIENLPLFLPFEKNCDDINNVFKKVDSELRKGNFELASEISSIYIYKKIFGKEQANYVQQRFIDMLNNIREYRINF